jgi:TolA-binding protein
MFYRVYVTIISCLILGMGCAHHTATDKGASLQVENQLLKERVRRLEHRVKDLDAKIMFLAQNKNRHRILKKSAQKKSAHRQSIDLDAPQDMGRVDFQTVETPELEPPFEAEQQGGALGPETIALHGDVRLAPRAKQNLKLAPVPVAVSPKTIDAVMDTPHGFAYMARASEQYEWARQQLIAHQCERAIPAFQNLIERFPKDGLADNAMYWSAFCFAELGNTTEAQNVWRNLPLRFPRSPKRADAMFQRATLLEQEGKSLKASVLYREMVKYFPRAEKSREASVALKRIAALAK